MKKIDISKAKSKSYQPRDCLRQMIKFVDDETAKKGRVMVLYGLRRTGKTTLMEQIAFHYGLDVCEMYETTKSDSMQNVYQVLEAAKQEGKTVVFLDEITNVPDFIDNASLLADAYAKEGINIFLAGTDSLGLNLVQKDELLGRVVQISTTYIPYAEHHRVFKDSDIFSYMRYGGLMQEGIMEEDAEELSYVERNRYLDSAVAGNIARSLEKGAAISGYSELKKYTQDDLEKIINKVVELYSGSIDKTVINREPFKPTVTFPVKKLQPSVAKFVDTAKMNREFADIINASCRNLSRPATEQMVAEMESTLRFLGLLSTIEVRTFAKNDGVWFKEPTRYICHIVQPAIKYYHLKKSVRYLMETPELSMLSEAERKSLSEKLREKMEGDMIDCISVYDTFRSLSRDRYIVCKVCFEEDGRSLGEYDMLVYDKEKDRHWKFEVKGTGAPFRSDENIHGQDKHLLNPDFTEVTESVFGKCAGKFVLYIGEPCVSPMGVRYLNLSSFLADIYKTKSVDKAVAEEAKEIKLKSVRNGCDNTDVPETKEQSNGIPDEDVGKDPDSNKKRED